MKAKKPPLKIPECAKAWPKDWRTYSGDAMVELMVHSALSEAGGCFSSEFVNDVRRHARALLEAQNAQFRGRPVT